ncbi:hypothetical protein Chor_005940 [Crotalus horridus]
MPAKNIPEEASFFGICQFILPFDSYSSIPYTNKVEINNVSLGQQMPEHQVFHSSPTGRCTDLQIQFTEAVSAVAEQKDLIAKLEHDVSTIQSLSAMHRPDAEAEHFYSTPWVCPSFPSPSSPSLTTVYFPGQPSSASTQIPEGQVDSLLSIISSQRERFRARNHELEAENRLMQHTMQALQSELDNLRADNIKLYEKIKFLQSYPGRGSGSDDTESRYSSQYEERLDPFTSFSRKVLYKIAWSESMGRDCSAYCAKKYADHLHKFHENGDNGNIWK